MTKAATPIPTPKTTAAATTEGPKVSTPAAVSKDKGEMSDQDLSGIVGGRAVFDK